MELQVIGTGSSGNAYVLHTKDGQLLLDAGLPYGEIVQALDFDTRALHGALITHSHMDHARAMPKLLAAGIDVYSTMTTADAVMNNALDYAFHIVAPLESFFAGRWMGKAFNTQHDVPGSVGYLLTRGNPRTHKILYLTDSYYCKYSFSGLTHIIIECNHIGDIIEKRWKDESISSDMYLRLKKSHFSLGRVLSYLKTLDLRSCRKIVLVHLSDENSDEVRMVTEVKSQTGVETVAARAGMMIDLDLCPF